MENIEITARCLSHEERFELTDDDLVYLKGTLEREIFEVSNSSLGPQEKIKKLKSFKNLIKICSLIWDLTRINKEIDDLVESFEKEI